MDRRQPGGTRHGGQPVHIIPDIQWIGEFFGLWGLANRLAALLGPMSYGLVNFVTGGDHRLALLSTLGYFVVGLLLLQTIDERRGAAARLQAG